MADNVAEDAERSGLVLFCGLCLGLGNKLESSIGVKNNRVIETEERERQRVSRDATRERRMGRKPRPENPRCCVISPAFLARL